MFLFDLNLIFLVAYVWGSDIDFMILHARSRPTRVGQKVTMYVLLGLRLTSTYGDI